MSADPPPAPGYRDLLQRSLERIQELQQQLDGARGGVREPVAVVGMACRLPGAPSADAFLQLLREGRAGIREIPPERWDAARYYDPELSCPGTMNTRWGGFLEELDQFDPAFFNLSHGEACAIDPQQRLALEVSYEALESAGLRADALAGSRTGVFLGVSTWDFSALLRDPPARGGTGIAASIVANRVSYTLDLRGPSLVVDTACSSSLVAVDLAVQALRSGRVDVALAGGVNVILSPTWMLAFSQAGMMAPDGRCKTFDAAANGYVRGEGCGVVVLRRLSDAARSGAEVLAVVRGAAANQDGRSNGLTAPSGLAQQAVLRDALADAGLSPERVGYVEAHGTGTSLGDTIEIAALSAVLGGGPPRRERCRVGSVKTNIGHLEAAAGIAGLIKVVLALRHGELYPHLGLNEVNPALRIEDTCLEIVREWSPWPRGDRPRVAGVSSFGFGGTNAHLVLEEAPARPPPPEVDRPLHLLALSARTPAALQRMAGQHAAALAGGGRAADLCFSANTARPAFPYRRTAVGPDAAALAAQLSAPPRPGGPVGARPPRVAMLFSGQGTHRARMGDALYRTQPVYRAAMDRCAAALEGALPRPLLEVLSDEEGRLLPDTRYAQPALFALEWSLAELWRSWGLTPAAVLGHSLGEYAAACVAGALELEEAIRLVARRAELMAELGVKGAMAMVSAPAGEVAAELKALGRPVWIASLNGPTNTVVAGAPADVEAAAARFDERSIVSRPLEVSLPFHTPLLEALARPLGDALERVHFRPPRIPLVANGTGAVASAMDARHFVRQMLEPVQFEAGVRTLASLGCDVLLEIGPSNTLAEMARRCDPGAAWTALSSLKRGRPDWEALLDALSALWLRGADADWSGFDRPYQRGRVPIPHYPFERRRCWPDPAALRRVEEIAHAPRD